MPIEARRQYLIAIIERYKNANRKQKNIILTEFCQVCGYNRKYAILILKGHGKRVPSSTKPGRKRQYNDEFIVCLKEVWDATGQICSKKLVAAMPIWLQFFNFTEIQNNLLLKIGSTSIDRHLKKFRTPKGISSTTPSMFRHKVPVELIGGYVSEPGHLEVDTVVHCGNSLVGDFVNTLTVTDLASGWTENRALWGKTGLAVVRAMQDVEASLPFRMKSFSSDNGTEFLNKDMESYLTGRRPPVTWTRRRPYKKNDAAHVEQKNWTHVRELFGYDRFDNIYLRKQMDHIYKNYWNVLQNFFIPVFKLHSKERIGARTKRIYDQPQTPYQRLVRGGYLGDDQIYNLEKRMKTLNPVQIRKELEKQLKLFWEEAERHRIRTGRLTDPSNS